MSIVSFRLSNSVSEVAISRSDRLALWLTAMRAPLVVALCVPFATRSAGAALLGLSTFILIDLADGEVARRSYLGDTALRRGLDSAIDRLGTALVMAAAGVQYRPMLWLAMIALATSVAAVPLARASYASRGVVLRAPVWHRVWSVSFAIAGAAYLLDHDSSALLIGSFGCGALILCTAQLALEHRTSIRNAS
jgi:phosphatidylglycerophosphate synthase